MRINVLRTRLMPILEQLRLEEALLRSTNKNWLIINDGTPDPCVVLGISGKPHKLVHLEDARRAGVPLIKRFTGGGTVIVDTNTIFVTMIVNNTALPEVSPFPCPIMKFTGQVYSDVFDSLEQDESRVPSSKPNLASRTSETLPFRVRENDYTMGDRKIAGNAQAITKGRWLHHTSFLWDFHKDRMALLQEPERRPKYRGTREHSSFLTPMIAFGYSRADFLESVEDAITCQGFETELTGLTEARKYLELDHLKSTKVIDYDDALGQAQ